MRFFLEFSYSGKNYHGWQRQPNAISVQEVIEDSLKTILRDSISLTAAGRTDTGVHARQMFAHFDTNIEKGIISNLVYELNQFLPHDVVIESLCPVRERPMLVLMQFLEPTNIIYQNIKTLLKMIFIIF